MTLSTILCPLDFSAASTALVAYAAALAVGTGAELRRATGEQIWQ